MKIKNNNKFKHIILYYLFSALIFSSLAVLTGCASYSQFETGNGYKNSGAENIKQKKLENKVLAASLKLSGVSGKRIKTLISSGRTSRSSRTSSIDNYYIKPAFMKKESNIINNNKDNNRNSNSSINSSSNSNSNSKKSPSERGSGLALNKTAKSSNGKIILKALSAKSDKIFEIISFSLANLYSSPIKCRLSLLKKSGKKAEYEYKNIPFKSDIGRGYESKNYFILQGLSKIKGEIIFLNTGNKPYEDPVSRLTLGISALYKSRFGGSIKFLKLSAKL